MTAYVHKVQYYETDKMGITHHSNYIRWMEEARIDFLDRLGFGFDKLEADGIVSPVVKVDCAYKKTTTFGDAVTIDVCIKEFKGVKLILSYQMTNQSGDKVCEAESVHCFLDGTGRPINLKNQFPAFYEALISDCLHRKCGSVE